MKKLLALLLSAVVPIASASAQNRSIGSAPDPYVLTEPSDATVAPGYRNIDGRTLVNHTTIGGAKKCVIAVFGQSNGGANYAQGAYTILNPTQIFNLNIYNGGVYQSAAPSLGGGGPPSLIGGTGGGETWLNRYADKLIAGGTCDRVVLVPASISSTRVADWAVGGIQNSRIGVTAKRIAAAGLQASGVIFMQGESDQMLGTSQASYAASLSSVISTIQAQAAFSGVPIFISQTSYYLGSTSSNVTNAQAAAVNGTSIFSLGSSDSITSGGRWDNIHFNATGADTWATTANTNSAAHLIVH